MAEAWDGGVVSERALCLREDNPGHMTLDGTNTWVLREPGAKRSVVVDPGELDQPHLDAVLAAAAPVAVVFVTHRHHDHTDGAARFAEMAGCAVRGMDPAQCVDGEPLLDGGVIDVDGLALEVVFTPGHTTDSICLLLESERTLLTGDTVLGRGTSVVAHPDGVLASYLESLDRMLALVEAGRVRRLLPGHGPVLEDARAVLAGYIAHRLERLDQVRAAVADGVGTARGVVERVYADVDPILWPAAELSVAAQLDYLAERA